MTEEIDYYANFKETANLFEKDIKEGRYTLKGREIILLKMEHLVEILKTDPILACAELDTLIAHLDAYHTNTLENYKPLTNTTIQ